MLDDLVPGDWVSLHWEWVCDRLTDASLRALRHYTRRHLDARVVGEGALPGGHHPREDTDRLLLDAAGENGRHHMQEVLTWLKKYLDPLQPVRD